MVFTPLLASTTVGTVEGRSVAVHITSIQKALFHPQNNFYLCEASTVNSEQKIVECKGDNGLRFSVKYDKLAISTGSAGSTFGIPGRLPSGWKDSHISCLTRDALFSDWDERDPGRQCCHLSSSPVGALWGL